MCYKNKRRNVRIYYVTSNGMHGMVIALISERAFGKQVHEPTGSS